MKKLTRRIAVAVSSVAVAGVAVLGAGGTASAGTSASAHVQRPAVSVNADDYRWDHGVSYLYRWDHGVSYLYRWDHGVGYLYRWDHGVGYLLAQGYSWDEIRGWHHEGRHEVDGR
ncbi:hypothetical protein [Streptomyces sp. NPDC059349]|uniref:hypothetical protein n=1 Tax=Streptomyces sp. NPDC059349 TaxID=3346808 RepID=UPI0036A85EAB